MLTETRSQATSLAGFLGTVRSHLSSTHALRSFIILSFFLYELPFVRRLTWGEDWLRLPLFDVAWVDDTRTFVFLEAFYVCASLAACVPRFVIPGCLLAGAASILLVTLDLTWRLQFAFLPGGALLAFAMSEFLSRSEHPKKRIDLPFVLFLGSIYAFASFHKLLNFQWMKILLPSSVFGAPGGPVPAICANAESLFLSVIAWTVVPYEALLAVLTVSRRCLKLRLACVSLFHWLLIAMVPFIWHVSLYMLSLHLYLAALQRPAIRRSLWTDRNWFVLFGAEGLFFGVKTLAPNIPGAAGTIAGAAAFACFVLFPVFFFFWPFWRAASEPFGEPRLGARGIAGAGVATFGVLCLMFGFSPFLLEKRYSVLSLGWSMFAGGEYRDGTYYRLKTPNTPCFRCPTVTNMLWSVGNERQIQYLAFRRTDLERLKKYFERRNCGGPPLEIETAKF